MTAANPKLRGRECSQAAFYPFYAGFSVDFARAALSSAPLGPEDRVLDPWIGSGTTAFAASSLGISAVGYDLNPAMAVVARARCAHLPQPRRMNAQVNEILGLASKNNEGADQDDPLCTWLQSSSVAALRGIEFGVQRVSVGDRGYRDVRPFDIGRISDLTAFFYVALFRTVKQILRPFFSSNPTWVRRPKSYRSRLRPSVADVNETFRAQVQKMISYVSALPIRPRCAESLIGVASSERIPLHNNSVACVLGSPPYCTRIDYAVATSPELAVLGFGLDTEVDELRRELIGTPTVMQGKAEPTADLGAACLEFLDALLRHGSKASSTYYYKNHVQYFVSLKASLIEIKRVLKPASWCMLVVQDSYYKDLHNDLPAIVLDMAFAHDFRLISKTDFNLSRTLAGVNRGAQKYRSSFAATESVLVLQSP